MLSSPVAAALRVAFLLSGCAALLFETLWFRQVGLLLGNAVWTSAIVLGAFMAGLALGNALAGTYGPRLRSPILTYAALELLIGLTGLALVLGLPALAPALLPLLHGALDSPALLNGVRLGLAFLLMLAPATAMGATLPLLVRAPWVGGFGHTLGHLYGWNTLGAVLGALLGELWLLGPLGVTGTGVVAASLNATAAMLAAGSGWSGAGRAVPQALRWRSALPRGGAELLAAFGAGAALLALEVVWFRFLLLYALATSVSFAVMLAIVLLGIGGGGLAAAALTKRIRRAHRFLPTVALAAGIFAALGYVAQQEVLRRVGLDLTVPWKLALATLPLVLPTCLLSGILFTLLGAALEARGADPAQAAAGVTVANTLGAMGGSLGGGLVLLPGLGIERSCFLLAVVYGLVSLCCMVATRRESGARLRVAVFVPTALAYLGILASFPFGLMNQHYLRTAISRYEPWESPDVDVLFTREGLTETLVYVRKSLWGTPIKYRLLSNAISMSGSDTLYSRYMRVFVYLPVALNPEARRALLIGYGVGVTAKALTETPGLASIDVVDISPDILALGHAAFPAPDHSPLEDPRVRVHVEDGRFFLLTTDERFDIITAEPPPPKHAGVGNLYSREFFRLLHDRLAEGGVATYWLPVYQMAPREAKAITRAFCEAFADCSLWSGFGADFVMMGTRGARRTDEEGFTRQWRDPQVLPTLRDLALDRPELLGSLFLLDAPALADWSQGVEALEDDHPHRISPEHLPMQSKLYWPLADPERAARRFAESATIREIWPPALRARTLEIFPEQAPVLRVTWLPFGVEATDIRDLHDVLLLPGQRTAALWLQGATAASDRAAIAAHRRGVEGPLLDEVLGASALADRDFLRAEGLFARARPYSSNGDGLLQRQVLALCLAGERERAARLVREAGGWQRLSQASGWRWLIEEFGLSAAPELPASRPGEGPGAPQRGLRRGGP